MAIKENSDYQDRYGRYPVLTCSKSTKLGDIHDKLWSMFPGEGYKFCIVFDESKDEYQDMNELDVLFLDEVKEEVLAYGGA